MRLASRFGRYNSIRRERPLTDDELMQFTYRKLKNQSIPLSTPYAT